MVSVTLPPASCVPVCSGPVLECGCGAVDGVGPLHYKVTLRHRLRPFKQHQITISERLPPTNPAGRFRELAWRLGVK